MYWCYVEPTSAKEFTTGGCKQSWQHFQSSVRRTRPGGTPSCCVFNWSCLRFSCNRNHAYVRGYIGMRANHFESRYGKKQVWFDIGSIAEHNYQLHDHLKIIPLYYRLRWVKYLSQIVLRDKLILPDNTSRSKTSWRRSNDDSWSRRRVS